MYQQDQRRSRYEVHIDILNKARGGRNEMKLLPDVKTSVYPMMSVLLTTLTLLLVIKVTMAQDPVQAASQNYKVLFENDRVRVLEYRSKPGEKAEVHSHPDYLSIRLRKRLQNTAHFPGWEKVKTIEGKAGTVSWQDAVTHALENVGTIDAHALLIELKK
jgi:hypothetical protein